MTTYVIDPRASTNGTGSAASPKNTYSGLTIVSQDAVLQVATTQYDGTITIPVGATGVTLGCCDADGNQISDGSAYAKVNANGQQFGIRVRETADDYDISGFEVFGANGSTQNWAFYLGNTQSQVANGGRLHHCIARDTGSDSTADSGGVKWFGSDITIEDVQVYNMPTDAFFGQGNRATLRRTKSWNLDQDGRGFGDNIQITGNATLGCSGIRLEDNWCDHRNSESKQAINIQDTTGGSVGALVFGNVCLMPEYVSVLTNGIYIEIPSAVIVANDILGAHYGVYCRLANNVVMGNLVKRAAYGLYQSSSTTGGKFYCNTVDRATIAAIYAATDTTFSARNNVLMRSAIGLAKHGSATEDYNCYYGNDTDQSNLGGSAAWGANNVMADPLLDASYRPRAGSPCIGAGTQIPGVILRDFDGKHWDGAVDIGTRMYHAPRSRTTRTAATGRSSASGRTLATNR